jgi:hypothetical protein
MKEKATESRYKRLSPFVVTPPYSIFSDPVWSFLFSGDETAPEIAGYIIRITLGDEKANAIGKITRVDPQHSYKIPGKRGSRVDVCCISEKGYVVLLELQFTPDSSLISRNLLATSHVIAKSASEGVDTKNLKIALPIIICVDFVNGIVRHNNTDCVQPARVSFDKPPTEVATEHWAVYYVQIPRFLAREPDFNDPLDCFLYAACESHEKHLTMREVISMSQQLQKHEDEYPGFGQLADRHAIAAHYSEIMDEYMQWLLAEMKYQGEMSTAISMAVEEKEAEMDAIISKKDEEIALFKAEIAALRAQLAENERR